MKSKKFNIFNNLGHSLDGVIDIWRNEVAFKIEAVVFLLTTVIVVLLPLSIIAKAVLVLSMPIVLIAEVINSAIERAVDTATTQYDENAKKAKDAASTIVLFAILLVFFIWCFTFCYEYKLLG